MVVIAVGNAGHAQGCFYACKEPSEMIKKQLSELFNAMHHGKYSFVDFMSEGIKENYGVHTHGTSGNPRSIYSPSKKLKAFHTFLNLFVFEYLPINEEIVFSYRKGFSVFHAVSKHSGSKYFFQTDIACFFANIDRDLIKKTILAGKDACPVTDLEQLIERILDMVCIENSLPIGFPASAPISNAALYTFDNDLWQYCKERDLVYTRYSDDIIISSQSRVSLESIDQEIQDRLVRCASDRFHLNYKKSKYFQIGGKIKILGVMILPNGKITIDSKLKKELEVLLHFYVNDRDKFLNIIGGDEQSGLGRITGYLNYANSIDQEYLSKLRKKFGATIIDTFLHLPLPKQKSKSKS